MPWLRFANLGTATSPYSLGKLIDWKPPSSKARKNQAIGQGTPYSLGKLIDWKRHTITIRVTLVKPPYSLGKLIDWKQFRRLNQLPASGVNLPTR